MQKKLHYFLNLSLLLASFIIVQNQHLHAQNQLNVNSDNIANKDTKYKTVRTVYGMNMTPLVIQLIPLKRGAIRTGPYNFVYKRKNIAKRRGFRAGIGANVRPFDEGLTHFNLRMGTERIRSINEHWSMTSGADAWFFVGSFNTPSSTNLANNFFFGPPVAFGGALTFGIEYHFNSQMSLSTESMLAFGLHSDAGGVFEAVPPISILLNIAFEKERRKQRRLIR